MANATYVGERNIAAHLAGLAKVERNMKRDAPLLEQYLKSIKGGRTMKNYELIAELIKLPAGHEVVFDSIVNTDDCITGVDADMSQVTKTIECVDFEENRIILC